MPPIRLFACHISPLSIPSWSSVVWTFSLAARSPAPWWPVPDGASRRATWERLGTTGSLQYSKTKWSSRELNPTGSLFPIVRASPLSSLWTAGMGRGLSFGGGTRALNSSPLRSNGNGSCVRDSFTWTATIARVRRRQPAGHDRRLYRSVLISTVFIQEWRHYLRMWISSFLRGIFRLA